MRPARTALWLLAFLPLAALPGSTPELPDLAFSAYLEISGPLMEVWEIQWKGRGEVKVEASWAGRGELQGEFYAAPAYLQDVARVVREQRFLELPASIHPPHVGTLDAPNFRIELTLDGKSHRVKLDDPGHLQDDPNWQRFRAVMLEIGRILPQQPKWP